MRSSTSIERRTPVFTWYRQLLWIDCSAALIAGSVMLLAQDWIAQCFGLPHGLIMGLALVNLFYGKDS